MENIEGLHIEDQQMHLQEDGDSPEGEGVQLQED